MPEGINLVAITSNEIVLSERRVTSEWRVRQIVENIENRSVRVEVELGPFVADDRDPTRTTGTGGGKNIIVWQNEEYDAIRDTWSNVDLLAVVATKLK